MANVWLCDETAQLKEFNEGIVQGVAEAILLIDNDGTITFTNPALAPMAGRSSDDLIGKPYTVLLLRINTIISRSIGSTTNGVSMRLRPSS